MKILDIGSGPVPKIVSSYSEIEIVHGDQLERPSVEVQNMEKLTYPDKSFEMVVCINALDHTKDALAALKEMLRVVKPAGLIYINCAIDQMTRHRKKHYWDAKADGKFINPTSEFDLKDYGFQIEFENGRMMARRTS